MATADCYYEIERKSTITSELDELSFEDLVNDIEANYK
jgi:hypothetical protein